MTPATPPPPPPHIVALAAALPSPATAAVPGDPWTSLPWAINRVGVLERQRQSDHGAFAAKLDHLEAVVAGQDARLAEMADALTEQGDALAVERAALRRAHDALAIQAATITAQRKALVDLEDKLAAAQRDLGGTRKERGRAERKGR